MELNWPAIGFIVTAAGIIGNFIYTWAVMGAEQKTQGREIRDIKTRQDRVDADLRQGGEQRAGMAANIETMMKQIDKIADKLDAK